MRIRYLTILFFLLCCGLVKAQLVMDGTSGDPIPFANVLSVANPEIGTSTLEDGTFTINVAIGDNIRVSSVGYKPVTIEYTGADLIVLLDKQIAEIQEVVITADESEAARVIRLSAQHRKDHAPWLRDYFQCILYNKYRVDMLKDSLAEPSQLVRMLEKRIKGETIFFSESAMTYHYEKPGRVEQHIIANNVVGFDEAQFNFLPEQLVVFDINSDFLDLLNRHYLLPISKGSERHYGLHLEETTIHNGDTTWYIQFWPEKSNFDLLRGHLIIHSDGYALEELRLTNNKKDHQKFDIYHHFRQVNGQWFPDKMFSNIVMSDLGLNVNVLYDQKTFIDHVQFDPVKIKIADANRIDFAEGVQANPIWIEKHRAEALSSADEIAIKNVKHNMDQMNIERKMDIIANLSFGRFPIGMVDLEISRFFWTNKTEGYRPGLGLITNDKFSKRIQLNGFFGYGLQDDQWKYGGGFAYHLNKQKSASVYLNYEKEVYPISSYVITDAASSIIANTYSDQLDDITAYTAGVRGRYANWKYDLQFRKSDNSPRYEYAYLNGDNETMSTFKQSEINLNLSYVKKKYVPFYTYEIELEEYSSTFLDLQLTYAPQNVFNSNVEYFRVELFAKRPINFKHLGRMELALHTGILLGDKILNRTHIGNGSNSSGIPYQLPYSFNTMTTFNFIANEYVNIFYDHRLVRLYQTRLSAPYIHIAQHSGWGKANNTGNHLRVNLKDYRQGYHESGFILESILRYEVFSIMQIGLNAGFWYRWGPYATGDFAEDGIFKLGFGASF